MQFTTAYLEASQDPAHKELLFIITQGNPTGKPIKEDEHDNRTKN